MSTTLINSSMWNYYISVDGELVGYSEYTDFRLSAMILIEYYIK